MFFTKQRAEISGELIRYILCGSLATMVDFALMVSLKELGGLHYQLSAALGFIGGVITSYFLCVTVVFKNYQRLLARVEAFIFLAISLVGLLLNSLVMMIMVESFQKKYIVAKIISIVLVVAFNFFSKKILLFNRKISVINR